MLETQRKTIHSQIDPVLALVTTYAGGCEGFGSCGRLDGSLAMARFCFPSGLALDREGNLFVSDWGSNSVRKLTPDGQVSTLGDERAPLYLSNPQGIALSPDESVFIADFANHRIGRVSPGGQVSYVNGLFYSPYSLCVNAEGTLFVACLYNGCMAIRRAQGHGPSTTLAGGREEGFRDGLGSAAAFKHCQGMTLDHRGNLYVADAGNHAIRKISPGGQVRTVAGDGVPGLVNGPVGQARFNKPTDVAVDAAGNIFVADAGNHCLRKITPAGSVMTLAGNGIPGLVDGIDVVARFNFPWALALNRQGDLFVADRFNHCIRLVTM